MTGARNKKAPEIFGGAWKQIWKPLSDHAPVAYDEEVGVHFLSLLTGSLIGAVCRDNIGCDLCRRVRRFAVGFDPAKRQSRFPCEPPFCDTWALTSDVQPIRTAASLRLRLFRQSHRPCPQEAQTVRTPVRQFMATFEHQNPVTLCHAVCAIWRCGAPAKHKIRFLVGANDADSSWSSNHGCLRACTEGISELSEGTYIFVDHPAVASAELSATGHDG